uniref:Uncharacterized protein n=1 Tax=Panagrolaimus sp. ES5 TaxID=591445 RepID=A0AC34GIN6_9BILA
MLKGGGSSSHNDGNRGRSSDIGNLIGGLIGGGGGNDPGRHPQSGGHKKDKSGLNIGSLIGGFIGDNKYSGGGPRTDSRFLTGGVSDMLGNLIGKAAHKYFGVDPATGKIIGSIAGNVIFQLGGKDNNLGSIGKKTLDRIITGKFRKHTEPFVKPEPGTTAGPTRRTTSGAIQDFYGIREE